MPQATIQKSPFAFHHGETLIAIAESYPTLLAVIMESVQNALDASARRVWITINQRARHLTVSDNGDGRSQDEFEEALTSVCSSLKPTGKLGRFGRGLVAAIGKCDRYTFTSSTKSSPRGYIEWEFTTHELRTQKVIEGIPMRKLDGLVFSGAAPRRGETPTPWRTRVRVERFSKDRIISRVSMEALRDAILERYGPTMRRLGTVVEVRITAAEGGKEHCQDITAEPYSGKKLPGVVIPERDAGDTIFRLYLARRTEKGRRGKVFVGEVGDEYRLAFGTFAHSTSKWLDEEAARALASGFFEGEILTGRAKLHPGRKGFVEDARLVGFCVAIETWFKEHGKQHYEEAQEQREDERFQEQGRHALYVFEQLLKRPEFAGLQKVIDSFRFGSVGRGHAVPRRTQVVGELEQAALATYGTDEFGGSRSHEGGQKEHETKKADPGHHPTVVFGPHGRQRLIVKSDSLGLHLSPEAMEGLEKAWEFDDTMGVLRFNTRHPLYRQCMADDRALQSYIRFVTIQALVLRSLPEEWMAAGVPRLAFDEMLPPYATMLRYAGEIERRKPGRPKKATAAK